MKATLVNVKPQEGSLFMSTLPGLAAPMLARLLDNAGIETSIIDENQGEADPMRLEKSDLVLLTFYTTTAPRAYSIATSLSKDTMVIMGGPHASFMADEALDHGADIVVRGLADHTLPELLQKLFTHNSLDAVQGISYRLQCKKKHNPDSPLPLINTVPVPLYRVMEGMASPYVWHPLQLARGCYYRCDFCQIKSSLPVQQSIPLEKLADFMAELEVDYSSGLFREVDGLKKIFIVDDNFGSKPVRRQTMKQLDYIKQLGWNIRLATQARIELGFDDELLQLFYEAGGRRFLLGIESMNDASLAEMHKDTTSRTIRESVQRFKQHHFEITGLFLVGYDHDTLESVKAIPEYARNLGLDCFNISILTPLPGTGVYQKMKSEGRIISHDWSSYDYHHCVIQPKQMHPAELEQTVHDIMQNDPLSLYNYARRFQWDFA